MTDWRGRCLQLAEALSRYDLTPGDQYLVDEIRDALGAETLLKAVGMRASLYNPLRRAGYDTVEQVLQAGRKRLLKIDCLGPKRVDWILDSIHQWQQQPTP
jgi:DNA-directed RNA polymerase alpha subunit